MINNEGDRNLPSPTRAHSTIMINNEGVQNLPSPTRAHSMSAINNEGVQILPSPRAHSMSMTQVTSRMG
jgi:hypothetical protein